MDVHSRAENEQASISGGDSRVINHWYLNEHIVGTRVWSGVQTLMSRGREVLSGQKTVDATDAT